MKRRTLAASVAAAAVSVVVISSAAGALTEPNWRQHRHGWPGYGAPYPAPGWSRPSAAPTWTAPPSAYPTTSSTSASPTSSPATPTSVAPTSVKPTSIAPTSTSVTPTSIAPTSTSVTPTSIAATPSGASGASTADPSGVAMPVGNLPGWKQIFADDFTTNVPVGGFASSSYASKWSVYPDGTKDTAGKQGYPSMYEPSQVISVSNGALDFYLHSSGGKALGAEVSPILPGHSNGYTGQTYGRYEMRFRADSLYGFKVAWLLWPDSGVWPGDGEIDFPESALDADIAGFVHHQGASSGSDQAAFLTTTPTAGGWHTAILDWEPNLVSLTLDGTVIGSTTVRIPDTPMHFVMQNEACLGSGSQNGSPCPSASEAGHIQVDWVTVYSPA